MLRKIILAGAGVSLLAGTITIANSAGRPHPSWGYEPSQGYGAGERSDPTNTNGY
jgi:hypothetical protein